MRKLFFLIFLVILTGVAVLFPFTILAEGEAKVTITECPTKAAKGANVTVKAVIENKGDTDYMWLYVAWNEVDLPAKDIPGEEPGGVSWNYICHTYQTLAKDNKTSCTGTFTMPGLELYAEKKVYVRAWGFHDESGWAPYDDKKTKTITLLPCDNDGVKEPGEDCDGADLGGATCESLGYTGGILACKSDCTFDKSGCTGAPSGLVCPGVPCPEGKICIRNPLCAETFEDLINAIIDFIFYVAIALVPLMVIIAGFCFASAGGDPKKVETAKKIILYTVIGLSIVLLAKGLYVMIEKVIGVSGG